VKHYVKKLRSRSGSTDNHATSGLKFKILVDFLSVGCSVLLSDVDVIWLTNPFPFLYRDSDVEGMTDGWDSPTSYGYDFGGGALRVFARNSGMFYLAATTEANNMMKRLAHRMETEATWDQTAYNEEQFYPAHGTHGTVGVTSRVMNYFCNLNSKTFFRFLREDAELLNGFRPVSAHVNYHPEKPQRMVDLHGFYYTNDSKGIWKWNGGEGSRLETTCKKAVKRGSPARSSAAVVKRVLAAGKAEWGGIKFVEFFGDGSLKTPWGDGKWGSADTPETIWAEFIGQIHLLTFRGSSYESTRCSDGEKVVGALA
jgi:arabinosyltransferase